jgi:hypothetical protein
VCEDDARLRLGLIVGVAVLVRRGLAAGCDLIPGVVGARIRVRIEYGIFRRAHRDIVDVEHRVVLSVVDGVNTAGCLLLDRAANLMVLPLLWPAESTGRRRRAEIGRAVAAAGAWGKATAWPCPVPSTTRAATGRTRTTVAIAAGSWGWPVLAGPCLADRQGPSVKRLSVELLDDLLSERAVGKLDESEASRATGLPIDRHGDVRWFRDGGEVGSKISFGRAVRQISDKKANCQGSS